MSGGIHRGGMLAPVSKIMEASVSGDSCLFVPRSVPAFLDASLNLVFLDVSLNPSLSCPQIEGRIEERRDGLRGTHRGTQGRMVGRIEGALADNEASKIDH